jgi:hypothetical protein
MNMMQRVFICLSLILAGALATSHAQEKPLDFARHVQPILAAKCMKCHGPGDGKSGLAFDTRERAFASTDSGLPAIVPGKADESEMIARITSADESTRMPPEGKPLTEAEVGILKRWIGEGANWSKHWAYRPLSRPEIPAVKNTTWPKNEIDHLILFELEQNGLAPNHHAEKVHLVRRAYFNLTGLPPTPAQVKAFVGDDSPDAWEKLIDELLASEHYGEHWARKWLDVVRFAETNSFERDNPKPHAWRYRDYVIRAFNDDKPLDEFLKQQLAGDEKKNPTPDDLIATGFYRLGVWDDEPADPEQAMFDGYDDLVTTVGQGMLGLTFNCARCHDHKIDPITQKDYYQLVAFFRNLAPMQTKGDNIESPIFYSDAERATYEDAVAKRQAERDVVQAEITALEREFNSLMANAEDDGRADIDDLKYRFYRDTWDKLPDFDNLKFEEEGPLEQGKFDLAPATRDTAFGFVFTGTLIVPEEGDYSFRLDSDDGARLSIDGKVVIDYDGIHGIGEPKRATQRLQAGRLPIRLDYFQRDGGKGLEVAWSGPTFNARSLATASRRRGEQRRRLPTNQLIEKLGKRILGEEKFAKHQQLTAKLNGLKADVPVARALCVKEQGRQAPDVFLLGRGSPSSPQEKVEPCFPSLFETPAPNLQAAPEGLNTSYRRTALAEWIASDKNLLTARVMANRIWQGHFGRGIVRSSNNFGGLGTPPTHPELLDWLATELIANGWKAKSLHKKIMMSSAYQMSSMGNEAAQQKDPANDLFWRVDVRRLSGEEVRDSILALSSELNLAMHGPSIYPTIQKEVLEGQSQPGYGWGKSTREEQARRSIYVHVKRSLITPLLASFDFPETDSSCEARFATTQPQQSFALLNSQFANDQAALFAARLKKEVGDDLTKQVQLAYELATGRSATENDISRAKIFAQRLENELKLTPEAARQQLTLLIMNLNEFLYLE